VGSRLVWAATDIGHVRQTNEDSFGLPSLICAGRKRFDCQGKLLNANSWAVIADGMGGHAAGEMASKIAVETFRRLQDRAHTKSEIVSIFEAANRKIYDHIAAGSGRIGMGSTLVGVAISHKHCFAFNIGDSRIYVRREAELLQLSVDHTPRSNRAGRSHALTQSLGGTSSQVPIFPHITEWPINRSDLLVLCSDGLSDMLADDQILNLLNSAHPQPALALVNAAVAAGGRDNVTAIVIGPEIGKLD